MIPVAGPSITELEIGYVTDAVTHCWYGDANKYHLQFEAAFARYTGVEFAVSLPSCTSGIHLALSALGIGEGDEVIVPEITWIASSAPVSYVGATPVFCDVDRQTWCIDVESVEKAITPSTKAIITVDLYGGMPRYTELRNLAERRGIFLIEDAAEAVGSKYKGSMAGSLGKVGVFSFHGSKTLTTGEGGMLVTDDADVYERVCFLRDHGRKPGDVMFENEEVAFKYKMSSMQAALGLGQLERVEDLVDRKRQIFGWYHERLGGNSGVELNAEPGDVRNSYWMSSIIVPAWERAVSGELMAELRTGFGVDTRPFFKALSSIPAYSSGRSGVGMGHVNPVSEELSSYVAINLPSALSLEEEDIEVVVDALRKCQRKLALPGVF